MDARLRQPLFPAALARATALAALAAILGVGVALHPLAVAVPAVGVLLVALAFLAPVTHLSLLLFMTAVVGYELQRRYTGHVLFSDALLLTGLLRAGVVMLGQRIETRRLIAAGLVLAFMVGVLIQLVRGLRAGNDPSYAAAEARILLGFGTLIVAMPIVADPIGRARLLRGLVVVGLLLGLWGLAQWSLGIEGSNNTGLGVRTNADFAVSGSGQLHGGLYGYPVAVVMAAAALLGGACRSALSRLVVPAVLVTNIACLLLTYERTFWLTTALALLFVIAKLGRGRRLRAAVATLAATVLLLGLLATAAPSALSTARERILSLGQASTDTSLRWRVVETRHLTSLKIKPRPLFGWGLGDFLHWGKPWLQIPPSSTWFAHNGYLWLIWKTGVLVTALLLALLAWAVATRAPPRGGHLTRTLRTGSQGALLALLLSSVSFPSFNNLAITAVMGTLMAICFMPTRPRRAQVPSPRSRYRGEGVQ
jgi:O-antigen ligase/polysaccharide polymerase Wzy-like membrane protein